MGFARKRKVRTENGKMIIVGYYFVECVLREQQQK